MRSAELTLVEGVATDDSDMNLDHRASPNRGENLLANATLMHATTLPLSAL